MTAAPLSRSSGLEPKAAEAPSKEAAKQLEAFFLRQFLSEARPKSQMLDGGFAGDTFRDMLDTAMADSMAAAGGLGLASSFDTALGGTPEAVSRPAFQQPFQTQPAAVASDRQTDTPDGVVRPTVGRYSSRFGVRADPIHHTQTAHNGLDIAAREGTPVVAAMAGTVERAGDAGTYGNLVVLRHADGSETRYAHLSAIQVKKGDQVGAGAPLGAVGSTGRSTGPHLHFEVRRDGRPIDPWQLLEGDKVGDTP